MEKKLLEKILKDVKNNKIDISSALQRIKHLPYVNMDFCKFDTHRSLRRGYPEVVLCQGKKIEHIIGIVKKMKEIENNIILTRVDKKIYDEIKNIEENAKYFEDARIILIERKKIKTKNNKKYILVISAGTSDICVAEEAAVTSEIFGNKVIRLYDVGVAGIHRLFDKLSLITSANVLVVVAGMEGALPSVVAGLVDKPVIAVPTSIGYGANFQGLAPLLTMLNSCSPGIAVVNIDNGFGAGYLASLINK